jgi:tetratricopeptide (TPR) repeat protein
MGMEKAVEAQSSDEFIRPLIANYLKFCNDFKENEMCPVYLYRCAVLYFRVNNFKEATINLERILRDYKDSEILEDTYLTLAMIYAKKIRNTIRVEELYTEYLEKFPDGKGLAKAEYFFLPVKQKLQDYIDNILKEINSLPRGQQPGKGTLSTLMFSYVNFVQQNPEAPLSPSYCLQGAKLAVRLNMNLIAIQLLNKIYEDYPDFSQYPDALLMLAVQYDTEITLYLKKDKVVTSVLNDRITEKKLNEMDLIAHAGKLYREILKKYPNHAVAPSAQSGIKNLGKKTSTVVKEFVRVQDSLSRNQTAG